MDITTGFRGREQSLIELFTAAFTASEGTEEGVLIGGLARDLMSATSQADIRVFVAEATGRLIGAGVFSRLAFPQDSRRVFLLSPMAVTADQQRKGVGQALLTHALADLRAQGVDIVMTYGDPDYYARVGFKPISEDQAQAPFPLRFPHGWLAQSLGGGGAMRPLQGPSYCVAALNRPELW